MPNEELPSGISTSPEPLQTITLSLALGAIGERLSGLEAQIKKQSDKPEKSGNSLLEIAKVIFGGWPALGFLFLILFYSPLRDALNAIPAKVRNAEEIGILGVSLKTTIKAEAIRLGANSLSETIPTLSAPAIQTLLRGRSAPDFLVSYVPTPEQGYASFKFPSDELMTSLAELQQHRLIDVVDGGPGRSAITTKAAAELIAQFESLHPGYDASDPQDGTSIDRLAKTWVPNSPLPKGTPFPNIFWQLTELGIDAKRVIVNAVAIELAPNKETPTTDRAAPKPKSPKNPTG